MLVNLVEITFVIDHLEHSTTCVSGTTTLAKASSAAGTSTMLLFVTFRRSRNISSSWTNGWQLKKVMDRSVYASSLHVLHYGGITCVWQCIFLFHIHLGNSLSKIINVGTCLLKAPIFNWETKYDTTHSLNKLSLCVIKDYLFAMSVEMIELARKLNVFAEFLMQLFNMFASSSWFVEQLNVINVRTKFKNEVIADVFWHPKKKKVLV